MWRAVVWRLRMKRGCGVKAGGGESARALFGLKRDRLLSANLRLKS